MLGSSVHYAQFVPASLFQISYRKEKQFGAVSYTHLTLPTIRLV